MAFTRSGAFEGDKRSAFDIKNEQEAKALRAENTERGFRLQDRAEARKDKQLNLSERKVESSLRAINADIENTLSKMATNKRFAKFKLRELKNSTNPLGVIMKSSRPHLKNLNDTIRALQKAGVKANDPRMESLMNDIEKINNISKGALKVMLMESGAFGKAK